MPKYRIAILPGDGVGKEVMEAAMIVLEKLRLDAEYIYGEIGWEFWVSEGNALPDRTIELLKSTDVALFAAITSKPKKEAEEELSNSLKGRGYEYFSPIVRLRQEFNLHTNLRPCRAYHGNPLNLKDNIDLVVFRENTEGMYAGVEFHPIPEDVMNTLVKNHPKMKRFLAHPLDEIAISTRIMTRKGCETILRSAFDYAKEHYYKSVTVVEKPNILRETGGLMMRAAKKVASEYPDIELQDANIDAMCMWLIKNPEKYSVLVCENMFGDIISDLCAQLVGGLGFASSGNIGDNYAIFEPTHGSAPKYTGLYKVNPMAMLLAVKLMLDYLKEDISSRKLENAIKQVILENRVKTYDAGGNNKTLEVAEEVSKYI